ncbi:MAG: ROK family protein [Saprospiraceae bacterium]|nr:ROK family protein [Saprospiraceae bacterium]
MKVAVGIDIGGTNIVWGFVDQQGVVQAQGNFLTADFSTPAEFVRTTSNAINEVIQNNSDFQLSGIGIGAPNGNYFHGTIEDPPNLVWNGIIPIRQMFEGFFDLPVCLTNDANAAAIGEMQFGAAKGLNDFVIITLGTGLGSGFVANGNLIYGHDGFAGELGHTIVEIDGRKCGCGRRGCLETYASATGIVRTAKIMLEKHSGVSLLSELDHITSKNIAVCAEKGDELALQIFDYTAKKLGFSLANTIAISSPEAIILFGGLANAGKLILEPTQRYMEQNLLSLFKNKVKLLLSQVPEKNAAILGAAALVWKTESNNTFVKTST